MASNARIEFPSDVGFDDPNRSPAGPASFNPGPVQNPQFRNIPPRTTRLNQKEEQAFSQPANYGLSSPQQINRRQNNDFYSSGSKFS